MKKSKFLKPFSFASLALLMGAAGVFAFAPLGASPNLANASEAIETTTEQGLITPKTDDPVIYTTESGLEIKWGNAAPSTLHSSLGSGNLAGFPYFTTQNGSTTYTWVIIGRNSNVTTINTAVQSFLFSTWQANNSTGNKLVLGNHFFDNTYETTTPAGSAINNVVPSKSYVNDNISFSINDITTNDNEIPSGSVLCLLNTPIDETAWSSSNMSNVMHISNTSNYVNQKLQGYNTNDTFGFGTFFSDVQTTTLTQYSQYRISSWQASDRIITSISFKFFPLETGYDTSGVNFVLYNYLTASQYASSYKTWSRGSVHCDSAFMFKTDGTYITHENDTSGTNLYWQKGYLRPACVISLA